MTVATAKLAVSYGSISCRTNSLTRLQKVVDNSSVVGLHPHYIHMITCASEEGVNSLLSQLPITQRQKW